MNLTIKKKILMSAEESAQYKRDSRERKTRPSFLLSWLDLDNWTAEEGLLLLVGIEPDRSEIDEIGILCAHLLDGMEYRLRPEMFADLGALAEIGRLTSEISRLKKIWASGNHPDRCPPKYFIEWARAKCHPMPWMDWAIEQGFIPVDKPEQHETSAPSSAESPRQRRQRISEYVNSAYAAKKTKESAYRELAKIEGCGVENIKRIYKG